MQLADYSLFIVIISIQKKLFMLGFNEVAEFTNEIGVIALTSSQSLYKTMRFFYMFILN